MPTAEDPTVSALDALCAVESDIYDGAHDRALGRCGELLREATAAAPPPGDGAVACGDTRVNLAAGAATTDVPSLSATLMLRAATAAGDAAARASALAAVGAYAAAAPLGLPPKLAVRYSAFRVAHCGGVPGEAEAGRACLDALRGAVADALLSDAVAQLPAPPPHLCQAYDDAVLGLASAAWAPAGEAEVLRIAAADPLLSAGAAAAVRRCEAELPPPPRDADADAAAHGAPSGPQVLGLELGAAAAWARESPVAAAAAGAAVAVVGAALGYRYRRSLWRHRHWAALPLAAAAAAGAELLAVAGSPPPPPPEIVEGTERDL